jgi:DNA-binding transcriptional LysR family regulator
MVPTARARALALPVRTILEGAEAVFRGDEVFDAASSRQIFRVGLEDAAQLTLLPALVAHTQGLAPGTSLRVVRAQPDRMVQAFETGEMDVAVTPFLPPADASLHSEKVMSSEYVVIARSGHPGVGRRLSLTRFLELGHVGVVAPNLVDASIDAALAREGRSRRLVVTVPNPATIPALVAQTDLVATLPRGLLRVGGTAAQLGIHRPPIDLDPVPVYLVHHERTDHAVAQRWLREEIRSVLEGLAAS